MTTYPPLSKEAEEKIIAQALDILTLRVTHNRDLFQDPTIVLNYLKLKLSQLEHEVFGVLYLDIGCRLIHDKVMFMGTVNHTTVYPREIIKHALRVNASNVILYHNHPNGTVHPTPTDMDLTANLKKILTTVDVKLVDHFIIAGTKSFSFKAGDML